MDEQGNDNGIYVMNRTIRMNIIRRSQYAMTLCVISLLTVCAFLPTFWNGFQKEWDDQWMVMNPLTVSPLNWNPLVEIFTTRSHVQWAPVNQMLYTLLFNFHDSGIGFHAKCS